MPSVDPTVAVTADVPWRPRRRELSEVEEQEVMEAFRLFDLDVEGKLRLRPLKMAFKALGVKLSKAQVGELMAEVADQEREGSVDASQFMTMVELVVGLRDTRAELCKAFELFLAEGLEVITPSSLQRVAAEMGEELTDEEALALMEGVDRQKNGFITENQFCSAMSKRVGDPLDDLESDPEPEDLS